MKKSACDPLDLKLESYDYQLPQENIAQYPAQRRDGSKLLVVRQDTSAARHNSFSDIVDYLQPGDVLVTNDTRVFPARLLGKKETGGKCEVFLLGFPEENEPLSKEKRCFEATALLKSSKRPARGSKIFISDMLTCSVTGYSDNGKAYLLLECPLEYTISEVLATAGAVPLPPYIIREKGTLPEDESRYQTVYAKNSGAVAAPTAGLHFTDELLDTIKRKGVDIVSITLHVGYGTFAPVRKQQITDHKIHSEFISISDDTAATINAAKNNGGKIWAVGTTTTRALEFSCNARGKLTAKEGLCDLYIYPGYQFKIIDNLITNFHLPKSSLLFLVSALCGREKLLASYREAIAHNYRFYSYGDAMAIIR